MNQFMQRELSSHSLCGDVIFQKNVITFPNKKTDIPTVHVLDSSFTSWRLGRMSLTASSAAVITFYKRIASLIQT